MDKNNKLPDKPQKQPTRFVILPLKPHLAKFLFFQDWDKLKQDKLMSSDWDKLEHQDQIVDHLIEVIGLNRYVSFSFEHLIGDYLSQLLGEQISKRNPNYSFSIYRGKSEINNELDLFKDKGYVFIKITFNIVYGSPPERQRKTTLRETVNSFNRILEHDFRGFIKVFSNYQSPNKALDQIYRAMGINESDIKKTTLLKYYYRHN